MELSGVSSVEICAEVDGGLCRDVGCGMWVASGLLRILDWDEVGGGRGGQSLERMKPIVEGFWKGEGLEGVLFQLTLWNGDGTVCTCRAIFIFFGYFVVHCYHVKNRCCVISVTYLEAKAPTLPIPVLPSHESHPKPHPPSNKPSEHHPPYPPSPF